MGIRRPGCDNGSWAAASHLRSHGTVFSENHVKGGESEGREGGRVRVGEQESAAYLVYGGRAIIRQDKLSRCCICIKGRREGGVLPAHYSIVYSTCHQCISIE